jgi:hypothetical protein
MKYEVTGVNLEVLSYSLSSRPVTLEGPRLARLNITMQNDLKYDS